SEAKYDHEKPVNIDTESRHHSSVRGAGTNQHADPGVSNQKIKEQTDSQAGADNDQPPDGIEQARHQSDGSRKNLGDRQRQRCGPPDGFHSLIEKNDDAESCDHLLKVVTVIEMTEDQELEKQPENQGCRQSQYQGDQKIAGQRIEGDSKIGAQHVLDAVREVDEVHHPEHERESGRDQEEQDAELEPVQDLDDNKPRGHYTSPALFLISSDSLWRMDRSIRQTPFYRSEFRTCRPPVVPPSPDRNPESDSDWC